MHVFTEIPSANRRQYWLDLDHSRSISIATQVHGHTDALYENFPPWAKDFFDISLSAYPRFQLTLLKSHEVCTYTAQARRVHTYVRTYVRCTSRRLRSGLAAPHTSRNYLTDQSFPARRHCFRLRRLPKSFLVAFKSELGEDALSQSVADAIDWVSK